LSANENNFLGGILSVERSKYSAGPQLTGYLYQCRLALLLSLQRLKKSTQITISIETLDDVVFDGDGTPQEIIEIKHHFSGAGDLSNSSVDLWKTLNIWIDLLNSKISQDSIFCIMTTAIAPNESATSFLKYEHRNVNAAEMILLEVARTSVSEKNLPIYKKFLALSKQTRRRLLDAIVVNDKCPRVLELDESLQEEIWTACERSKVEQFLIYLEGWWYKRVLKSINDSNYSLILGEELESKINGLREEFKIDSLPIHEDLKTVDVDKKLYEDFVFVHQLKIINVTSRRVAIAINNYYRAFEQRSRWMREDLILVGDIEDYEKGLVEEWNTRFETMKENLGEKPSEERKIEAARAIYAWIEQEANFPIRPHCQENFITRGSYHILSDRSQVGWHVEFKERIASILNLQ